MSATLPAMHDPRFGASGDLAVLYGRSGVPGMGPVAIRAERVRLGQSGECDVVVTGRAVAPVHAELQRREGLWWLTDLGSDSGSWVDDAPVVGATPVAPGSTLRLGEAVMVFDPADLAAAPAPVTAPRPVPVLDLQATTWAVEDDIEPAEPISTSVWPRRLLWGVVAVGLIGGLVALFLHFVRVG